MSIYQRKPDGSYQAATGGHTYALDGEEFVVAAASLALWSANDLAALGLYVPAAATEPPDGKVSTGVTVEDVGGVPTYVHQLRALTTDELKAYAAARRYAVETGGIVVDDVRVDTGRDSQAMITGAVAYAANNPTAEIQFKAASGWVVLSAAAVLSIASAVGAHVQAAFAAERALDAEIDAGAVATYAAIDAWNWP